MEIFSDIFYLIHSDFLDKDDFGRFLTVNERFSKCTAIQYLSKNRQKSGIYMLHKITLKNFSSFETFSLRPIR